MVSFSSSAAHEIHNNFFYVEGWEWEGGGDKGSITLHPVISSSHIKTFLEVSHPLYYCRYICNAIALIYMCSFPCFGSFNFYLSLFTCVGIGMPIMHKHRDIFFVHMNNLLTFCEKSDIIFC